MTLETLSGIKSLRLNIDTETDTVSSVSVDMGTPSMVCTEIPVIHEAQTMIEAPVNLDSEGISLRLTAVSMGNPHGVVFVAHEPTDSEVLGLGPKLEYHPMWPDRANIEFCKPIDRHRLQMRVWERGSGETWACGTGACAAATAAVATNRCDFPVRVDLRGGTLLIDRLPDGHIIMEGPAEEVYTGTYRRKKITK